MGNLNGDVIANQINVAIYKSYIKKDSRKQLKLASGTFYVLSFV
jgi:hypothetical protein